MKHYTPRPWRNISLRCLFSQAITLILIAAHAGAENLKKIDILPLSINSDKNLARIVFS